jgi:hypothetical protein
MKEDAVNWGAPPLHGTNVSYPWVNFQAGATHGGKKEGIIVPSGRARSPRRPFPAFWPPVFERRGRRSRMPVCQKAEDSVRLFGVFGDFVPFHRSAFQTLVDQLIAFFGMVVDADRFHQTAACVFPVTGQNVHMLRIQAIRTMVPAASVGQRLHVNAAKKNDRPAAFAIIIQ